MNRTNRQSEILQLIQSEKCSSVKELCAAVYASPATIRRDLHAMEADGLIRMQYGNIMLMTEKPRELPLAFRENQAKESKRAIARLAASMIPANATVMLDSSSSALYMADYISSDCGITVFTNCFKTAVNLCENGITVYFMGESWTSGIWSPPAPGRRKACIPSMWTISFSHPRQWTDRDSSPGSRNPA